MSHIAEPSTRVSCLWSLCVPATSLMSPPGPPCPHQGKTPPWRLHVFMGCAQYEACLGKSQAGSGRKSQPQFSNYPKALLSEHRNSCFLNFFFFSSHFVNLILFWDQEFIGRGWQTSKGPGVHLAWAGVWAQRSESMKIGWAFHHSTLGTPIQLKSGVTAKALFTSHSKPLFTHSADIC